MNRKKVPRRIFLPKKVEVRGDRKDELHNLHSLPNTVTMVRSIRRDM
jgi:hypothetical protein